MLEAQSIWSAFRIHTFESLWRKCGVSWPHKTSNLRRPLGFWNDVLQSSPRCKGLRLRIILRTPLSGVTLPLRMKWQAHQRRRHSQVQLCNFSLAPITYVFIFDGPGQPSVKHGTRVVHHPARLIEHRTNSYGNLDKCYPKLADQFPDIFPNREVCSLYLDPLTSASPGYIGDMPDAAIGCLVSQIAPKLLALVPHILGGMENIC
ncbi:hypothetical protein C8J57DRAFT_1341355 [Mycena rebaudengoi]|nr:hypothetical protein C8J57DRAFT_1341355 [Mycena rebaudengoi]